MLQHLWFDSQNLTELWYCGNKVEEADAKLLQISIQSHKSYWKALEYQAWLLFYFISVMYNILPLEYLAHHMLLVEAMHTLLHNSTT